MAQARAVPPPPAPAVTGDGVKVGTFLGNYGRRYYGQGPAPEHLDVIWKVELGSGWSSGKYDTDPPSKWAGSGWTGQPNIVVDGGKTYVIASSYEYKLRKIDAQTGEVLWAYEYDDIIKGSPTVFKNPSPTGPDDKYIVVAGSRRGYPYKLDDPRVAPVRAVTFGSGKELWRLPVPQTDCYSRDCDGSGFFFDGTYYLGVESGWFYALDPLKTADLGRGREAGRRAAAAAGRRRARREPRRQPRAGVLRLGARQEPVHSLRRRPRVRAPALRPQGGLGLLHRLRPGRHPGADEEGPPAAGRGEGVHQGQGRHARARPVEAGRQGRGVVLPDGNRKIGDWAGGIVGSAAVNDEYNEGGQYPAVCAFSAIDGYLYLVSQTVMSEETVSGPDRGPELATPVQIAKIWNGGAISTPIIVGDALVAGSYDQRVHLYDLTYTPAEKGDAGALPSANGDGAYWTVSLEERDQFYAEGAFESTPTLWDGRVYIGCRDGWFYCLGDKP